ncbi:MAG: hypothetical protein V6Z86_05665 [Hyphomicrobiales bacterium]
MFVIVENAGFVGECDIEKCDSEMAAIDRMEARYSPEERDELHLSIVRILPDGTRTYDF